MNLVQRIPVTLQCILSSYAVSAVCTLYSITPCTQVARTDVSARVKSEKLNVQCTPGIFITAQDSGRSTTHIVLQPVEPLARGRSAILPVLLFSLYTLVFKRAWANFDTSRSASSWLAPEHSRVQESQGTSPVLLFRLPVDSSKPVKPP